MYPIILPDQADQMTLFPGQSEGKSDDRGLALRLGLNYSLTKLPRCALEAFNQCMQLDEDDPVPAMLASKLMLEEFNDPSGGLFFIERAIERCQKHLENPKFKQSPKDHSEQTHDDEIFLRNLLSRSYLLASIMHAIIYEQGPESSQEDKKQYLESSLRLIEQAIEANPDDYLVYFHKALHESRHQKAYQEAIDNLMKAIKINPQHVPSMQLLILTLSALRHFDKALALCESACYEFEDNLLFMYIKCNLEQCLVETKGYKSALLTARDMLKCIRRDIKSDRVKIKRVSSTKLSTTSLSTQVLSSSVQSNNHVHNSSQLQPHQYQYPNQSQNHHLSQHHTMTNISSSTMAGPTSLPVPSMTPNSNTTSPTIANMISTAPKQGVLLPVDEVNDYIVSQQPRECPTGEMSVWLLVAEIFVKIGSIEDAEQCVEEALAYVTGALEHQVMFVRGLIAKAKNSLTLAKTYFRSCLDLCPGHAKALQQKAHVSYLLGEYLLAEKLLKNSLMVDGGCFKSWHYLSLVYIEQNQQDRAKECIKKATELEGSSPIVPFAAISRLIFA